VRKKQDDDDDIVFGQSRMSLKDPLSYMRLVRPVRSTRCSHLQCFEAKWWIIGNEKHPQWLCPLCNRALRFDELIVDGYSLDILDVVPEKYDEVVIEADNAWHTEDGAYGSASWLRLNATSAKATREPTPKNENDDDEPDTKPDQFRLSSSPDLKGKRKAIEILSSDDEDYEQPLAKTANDNLRPPANNTTASASHFVAPSISRPASAQPPPVPSGAVIDLTLSDSDDDVEDAVTNFDRSNERQLDSRPLVPASSPRSTSVAARNDTNGHTNGASNGACAGLGPSAASTSTSAQAAPTHRYVPPYMANPHDTFSYNPNARPHKGPSNTDRWRPAAAAANTGARPGSGSASGSGSAAAAATATGTAQDTDPADSYRRRAALDELKRKRDRERERERDRDRGMDTDSEDDEYRYRR
jgi:hypothetical protein